MKFEAPQFDERHNPNIPHEHPLAEWWRMCGWLVVLGVAIWLLLGAITWALPRIISLEQERAWFHQDINTSLAIVVRNDAQLQALADELAVHMAMPQGSVQVYIVDFQMINAFATLGGNVVMMRGLLDKLPSEEAVALVLAHEMAHIKHRDPLRSLSRGVLLNIALAAIFGADKYNYIQQLSQLENLRYSRDLEEAADEAALHAVAKHYQNVGSVQQVFRLLEETEEAKQANWAWFNSHPHPTQRADRLNALAKQQHYALHEPTKANPWRNPATLNKVPNE